MKPNITGIGSVTPFGPLAGLIPPSAIEPTALTAWPTNGLRRAFLVEPFNPAAVIPGLRTRRLDRLSAWALVAASLAIQDANLDLAQLDRSRIAVVLATDFGCIELTAAFFQSAYTNGWSGTDPITFPETLANSAAGHVALVHGLRGPNITFSTKSFGAESALLQATSLMRHGQADLALVIAGDTLVQAAYDWYETARVLSPACFSADAPSDTGFIPGEGVVALVLEPEGSRPARSYAQLQTGRWAAGGDPIPALREMLITANSTPNLVISAGNGAPCTTDSNANPAHAIVGLDAIILPPQPVASALSDSGGLFHLLLALSSHPAPGDALLLTTSSNGGYAGLLFKLP